LGTIVLSAILATGSGLHDLHRILPVWCDEHETPPLKGSHCDGDGLLKLSLATLLFGGALPCLSRFLLCALQLHPLVLKSLELSLEGFLLCEDSGDVFLAHGWASKSLTV
jgi:hypothetical protein